MKVLFLVHNLGKTRHFEGVIQELTKRGHTLVITAAHWEIVAASSSTSPS